jgi:hypothetical protein
MDNLITIGTVTGLVAIAAFGGAIRETWIIFVRLK